jgi:hypothetical protein
MNARALVFLSVAAVSSAAQAQQFFPEQRAELAVEAPPPELANEAPAETSTSTNGNGNTNGKATPESVEDLVRRLWRMLMPGGLRIGFHGYFRAPLRLSLDRRTSPKMGESAYNLRTPWLVDDDYFNSGFAYTRLQEQDWSELYLTVGNQHMTGVVALMGSLFSDWAKPIINNQWGIAQAYLRFNWGGEGQRGRFRVAVKAGAFWDRFGWLPHYDTYLFGRTHQLGAQARVEAGTPRLTLWLVNGVGAHLEDLDSGEGLTLLNYVTAGVRFRQFVEAGFYFLDSLSHDQRQLKNLDDADMRVYGFDARLAWQRLGSRLYLGFSKLDATNAYFLGPAIEVMHAYGGRGLTENYLGTESSQNGTGGLTNFAWDYSFSARDFLRSNLRRHGDFLGRSDITLGFFGAITSVRSKQVDAADPQVNRDGRELYKYGIEAGYTPLSWLGIGLRYDRVILDVKDDANSFRVISPRISLHTHWLADGEIFIQYSAYSYGQRVRLRPGQVALETQPDSNAFKIQAQLVW